MSLLAQLRGKRAQLRSTATVVTCADGRRFVEHANGNNGEQLDSVHGFVVDTKPDDIPAIILDSLLLGAQDCCAADVLERYQIDAVLSVGVEPFHKSPNVQYRFVECYDLPETDIIQVLRNECVPFISNCLNKQQNVLVHCNAGVSRSASIVIGYLMCNNSYSYEEAYNFVKTKRPCIRPNPGFEKQLRQLQNHT